MRIAVITCEKYRDTREPFTALFQKFWPDCNYPIQWYSDSWTERWCSTVMRCAKESDEPLLLMQDDMFLTATVAEFLVEDGLRELDKRKAGCVRIYPMPGGTEYYGHWYFYGVPRGTRYRISCQASIWKPQYLHEIARRASWTTGEAGDMENLGSPVSDEMPDPVLAYKSELRPWPMNYLNAISRGLWNPDAIKLCEKHGIALDRSMREVAD